MTFDYPRETMADAMARIAGMHGGVLLVPAPMPLAKWERFAPAQQAELMRWKA